ncbi:MAG TPA: class I SAM-dependent methyltransferase [Candidatus Binataceae bacterium]|nr:class I SAM-dependent methyltransferase [Candidatus Binataceae bacterium]
MSSHSTSDGSGSSRVKEYFGRLASTYGDGAYYGIRRKAVVNAIANEIAEAREILDLGCGNGAYLVEFASFAENRRLFGIDLAAGMVAEARRRLPESCRLACGDISRLPFRSESLDLIFTSHVLQFVPDPDAAVRDAARCLKPGGYLIAAGLSDGGLRRMLAQIAGVEREVTTTGAIFANMAPLGFNNMNPARHQSAFLGAGLEPKLRAAPFTIVWTDISEWVRIRWMPVIPDAERGSAEKILAEMAHAAAGRTFAVDEPVLVGRKGN